jgi:hypothetical protein
LAFGWSGFYLYEFFIHGKTFGCNAEDPRSVCLGDFQLRPVERFRYRYNFLAFWESDLRLEATVPLHEDLTYPRCVGGRHPAPDEDDGGAWDYQRLIDRHPEVLWWYRNKVGPENFSVQGFRKPRIFPDFVVQNGTDERPVARVVVVESKGRHLGGNPDTNYKKKVAEYFEKVGEKVSWQELGEGFDQQQFRFQVLDEGLYESWKSELNKMISISA